MKKFISYIAAAAIAAVCAVPPPLAAFAAVTEEDGITALLNELNIMNGDESGNMGLDRLVSRAEFAKIAIAASPSKNTVALGLKMSPYKDVPYTEWYAPYVRAAVSAGYVKGYLDATYRPDNTVTYEEAVTVMLRILGYNDSSFGAAYPYGQIAQAQGLDLLDDVNGEIGQDMTRRQVMRLVYNALKANVTVSTSTRTTTSTDSSSGQYTQGANGSQSSTQSSSTSTTVGTSSYSGSLLGSHDCEMIENADIIAGYAQDSSLGRDKIFASGKTYTKGEYFNDSCVGMTGTMFIKNGRDLIAFVPDENTDAGEYESYFIYSTLTGSVVGYRDGEFETISIPDSATVYRNQSPTTYSAIKGGLEMGDTLYVKRTGGGSIDYITYESGTMEGPLKVTSSGWLSLLGAGSSSTVMRDGIRSAADSIAVNDIVYYSEPLNMVFAYSNKVTGVYESASPTKDAPSRVRISGIEYEVEGVDAFDNLSSSGRFNYGDTVTICLGKDGGAAGVVTAVSPAVSGSATLTGYITSAGSKVFTDGSGREYSSYYVTAVLPDGTEGTYETTANRSSLVGSVCRLTIEDGKASVGRVTKTGSVSGRVSYSEGRLGSYTLSPNVNILDVYNDNVYDKVLYTRIFAQRIDGINLSSSNILYCEVNAMNEITALILDNVTGDVFTYGIVTSSVNGMNTINVNGTSSVYQAGTQKTYAGPVRFIADGGTASGIINLSRHTTRVTSLTRTEAVINNISYKLASDAVCYRLSGMTYSKISIDDAMSGDYKITAYYDKAESSGGRIRILVCE